MQEHILYGTYKSYAWCFWVGLPTLNQVQWSETSVGRFEGIAWVARYLTFRVLWMSNNRCDWKRIFQNKESSSNVNKNRIPHTWNTYACTIHQNGKDTESIRHWPWPITFLSFHVLGVFQSLSFIFLQTLNYMWFRGVKINCQE